MDEDNTLGDGEKDTSEPVSPIISVKKFKLNDGSSQHSLQEPENAPSEPVSPIISVKKFKLNDGSSQHSLQEPENAPSEPLSPIISVKKFKLNDGSSQHSLQEPENAPSCGCSTEETGPSTSQSENMDSEMSPFMMGSTSDVKSPSTSGLSNEVVTVAASGSNVRTILMNIKQPNRRNYRKRKTPEHDTDSNASKDSDDLSNADEAIRSPPSLDYDNDSLLEADNADLRRLIELCGSDTDNSNPSYRSNASSTSSSGSSSSPRVLNDYESDVPDQLHTGETDTDDEAPSDEEASEQPDGPIGYSWGEAAEATSGLKKKIPDVLLKERPKHNYLMLKEIINREMGLTFPYGKTTKEDVMFTQRFYGSLHSVYRLKKLHSLHKHKGCVNSINFHPEGQLLVSGSDDTNIVIWDWASRKALQSIKTGHKSNVFQSKFLYLNAESQLNIVTCARDGQVRLIQCPSSGGPASRRRLYTHTRGAHKLHVSAAEPHSVLSAGEDGLVMHADVRTDKANRLFQVKEKDTHFIPLYSVHGHPLEPNELIVAGRDKFIRMYDRRKCAKPLAQYSPTFFDKNQDRRATVKPKSRLSLTHLTCAIYNHNGKQILGSYNDEDIYLFDVEKDVYDKDKEADVSIDGYTKRYAGHRNSATFKGVSFFGPNSEYVVSGSDCSHIYIWSTSHESIVQWMKGDISGVVNCIEAHPRHPVLATSGLDRDVKIWIPKATADPIYDGLERVVRENSLNQVRSPLFNDFLPTLYSAWRSENPTGADDSTQSFGGNIDFDGNVCTTF